MSGGPAKFAARFAAECAAELAQVTWPSRREALRYAATVLAFLAAATAATLGVDAAAGAGALALFG